MTEIERMILKFLAGQTGPRHRMAIRRATGCGPCSAILDAMALRGLVSRHAQDIRPGVGRRGFRYGGASREDITYEITPLGRQTIG